MRHYIVHDLQGMAVIVLMAASLLGLNPFQGTYSRQYQFQERGPVHQVESDRGTGRHQYLVQFLAHPLR